MRTQPVLILQGLGCWLALLLSASRAVAVDQPDSQTLVYFTSGGPLIVTLDITLNGRSLTGFRAAFIDRQYQQYDKDKSGELNSSEAALVPALSRIVSGSAVLNDKWRELDRDPQDDRLSRREFAAHYEAAMGPAFTLQKQVREKFQEVDLFARLDVDLDRALVSQEIQQGQRQLNRLDLDDDETISAAELAPLFDPSQRAGTSSTAESTLEAWPFLLVTQTGDGSPEASATHVLKHYDRLPENPDGALERVEIPDAFERLKPADTNNDERLSAEELTALVRNPREPLKITVKMPERGTPAIDHPELPDRTIEFRVRKWAGDVSDTISLYRIRFLQNDRDRNKYLDMQEFPGLQLMDASFALCDLNGDGMLMIDELTSFVDQRSTLSRCRVIMRVETDQRSLFEILDENSDRRLSHSEFLSGPDRMKDFDVDQDGVFRQGETITRFRVVVEMARTELFQNLTLRPPTADAVSPRLQTSVTGPVWFQRMDMNRDGTVSRREFLGPLSDFDRFDEDRDGRLTSTEVESAP